MDAQSQSSYASRMAEPFVLRERWFDVSASEFEAFLRDYPRPLEARPRGRCLGYQIRLDLILKVSAQERGSCQWCD